MKMDFATIDELLNWLMGRESRYEIYIAKQENTIVAMPTVSTRPIKVGICPYKESLNNTIEKIKKVLPDMEGKIFLSLS